MSIYFFITKNKPNMFGCLFGQKEKVNPDQNIEEITKNNAVLSSGAKEIKRKEEESIESESRLVMNQMLDYIKYPHKYPGNTIRFYYSGGFEVDFDPLIDIVNKCPGVGLKRGTKELYYSKELHDNRISRKEGLCYYLIIRHVWPDEVLYVIW
jgi:hypothetical protein